MDWVEVGTNPGQLLSPGRSKPTLVVNQGTVDILLSEQSSIGIGLRLRPGFGYQCDTDINLWAKTDAGSSIVVLHNSHGVIFQSSLI
jgi:hypothetical protein